MPTLLWNTPPTKIISLTSSIHVWSAVLHISLHKIKKFYILLSPEEKMRVQRFFFKKDRNNFIAARGFLRSILSCYTHLEPQNLCFSHNQYGKPSLIDYPQIQFNLSHSYGVFLLAVSMNKPLGIDVEYMKRECDVERIARRFFSPQEYAALMNLPNMEKTAAFFKLWVKKEAFLKGLGHGLFALKKNTLDKKWFFYPLNPAVNFSAILASNEPIKSVCCWKWDGKSKRALSSSITLL